MDNILVLGAIAPFCDLIKDVQEKGYKAIACDYYEDAAAKKMADYAYNVSTMDEERVLEVAKKHQVKGVLSAFSDRNLDITRIIASQLGLFTFYNEEIIRELTDKQLMKRRFEEWGLPIIPYKKIKRDFFDEELQQMTFPVVTKPIDSYGSKGIFVCYNCDEIRENFDATVAESLNYEDEILVEEYYPYDEISISAWVKDGTSYITCVYDVGKNFAKDVSLSSIIFPSKYCYEYSVEMEKLVQFLVDKFSIKEGPITVQCFIGPRGLKVSELLYRLAGGSPYIYPTLYGGPNTAKMLVDFIMQKEIDYQNLQDFDYRNSQSFYEYKIVVKKKGIIDYTFTEESIRKAIPTCEKVIIYRQSGENIINVPKNGEPILRVFCKVEDREQETYTKVLELVRKVVEIFDESEKNIAEFNEPLQEVKNSCYAFVWNGL